MMCAHGLLDLIGEPRQRFSDGSAEMAGYRNTADLCHALIDLQVAAIGREKSQTDWDRVVDRLKVRRRNEIA